MNDEEFLIRFRQAPPGEFTRALYEKINPSVADAPGSRLLHRLAVGLAALIFALGLTLAASPAARAYLAALVREIGGLPFEETDQYPGGGPVEIIPSQTLSLDEVRLGQPFPLGLPGWVPEGMIPCDQVSVTPFQDGFTPVTISWRNPSARTGFDLTVVQEEAPWVVAPGSTQEVTVNSQPAALTRGGWNADEQTWDENLAITLIWKIDEQVYMLSSITLEAETLIRIAESIPAP
ncbi:MAG: DUF4367 domain-containing protein [Anaerolineales bacterium]|nr:DUF4367 domain-containing protein [Anaerolineales bacterium]